MFCIHQLYILYFPVNLTLSTVQLSPDLSRAQAADWSPFVFIHPMVTDMNITQYISPALPALLAIVSFSADTQFTCEASYVNFVLHFLRLS